MSQRGKYHHEAETNHHLIEPQYNHWDSRIAIANVLKSDAER